MSTLVSKEDMIRRALSEGVDVSKIHVIVPRWAESRPYTKGVQSALVHCDLILRSDRSAVYLDGMMGTDSVALANRHINDSEPLPPWKEYISKLMSFPKEEGK